MDIDRDAVRTGTGLVVKGVHRLFVDAPAIAASTFRPQMDRLYAAPLLAFTPLVGTVSAWSSSHVTTWSGIVNVTGLPVNVNLMTLEAIAGP